MGEWCGERGWCRFNKLLENVRANRFIIIIVIFVMVIRWIRQVTVYVLGMRAVTLVVSYKVVSKRNA